MTNVAGQSIFISDFPNNKNAKDLLSEYQPINYPKSIVNDWRLFSLVVWRAAEYNIMKIIKGKMSLWLNMH
jgi:hypothetical protein